MICVNMGWYGRVILFEKEKIMGENEAIPLGKRKVMLGDKEFTLYRTVDGIDWISSRQAAIYVNTSFSTMKARIDKWEEDGRLKREAIRGNVQWIPLPTLEEMKKEIHSIKD
jgi:hypothetical protein